MSILVGRQEFDGPGLLPDDLLDLPGVYLLLQSVEEDLYELIDVGQFERLRSSWNSVDFKSFEEVYAGSVTLAVWYDLEKSRNLRTQIVQDIIVEFGAASCIDMPSGAAVC